MNEDPVLHRIDRTLDRIDARLKQSERNQAERETRWGQDRAERDAHWAQDRAEREARWEQDRAERDAYFTKMREQDRRFHDALFERHALITADQIAALEAIRRQMAEDSAALQAEIADQGSQIRAQTEALMKVMDRLPPDRPQG